MDKHTDNLESIYRNLYDSMIQIAIFMLISYWKTNTIFVDFYFDKEFGIN